MEYILKLDYDSKFILKTWKRSVKRVYRIWFDKRDYFPFIKVHSAQKTRKGWHVYVEFKDAEIMAGEQLKRADILILQGLFESDITRSGFDRLRIPRKALVFNALFNYKNGRETKSDVMMLAKMNRIIEKIEKYYENKAARFGGETNGN